MRSCSKYLIHHKTNGTPVSGGRCLETTIARPIRQERTIEIGKKYVNAPIYPRNSNAVDTESLNDPASEGVYNREPHKRLSRNDKMQINTLFCEYEYKFGEKDVFSVAARTTDVNLFAVVQDIGHRCYRARHLHRGEG